MEGLPYDEYGNVHPSGHAPHKPTAQIRTWLEGRGLTPIGTRPYLFNRRVAPLAVTAPDSSHDVGPRPFWGGGINRRSGQRCREAPRRSAFTGVVLCLAQQLRSSPFTTLRRTPSRPRPSHARSPPRQVPVGRRWRKGRTRLHHRSSIPPTRAGSYVIPHFPIMGMPEHGYLGYLPVVIV